MKAVTRRPFFDERVGVLYPPGEEIDLPRAELDARRIQGFVETATNERRERAARTKQERR